jgi:hypothetical protein
MHYGIHSLHLFPETEKQASDAHDELYYLKSRAADTLVILRAVFPKLPSGIRAAAQEDGN